MNFLRPGMGRPASRNFRSLITISVGVAQMSEEIDTPEKLIDQADQALYAAKKSGRNRVVVANVPQAAGAVGDQASS